MKPKVKFDTKPFEDSLRKLMQFSRRDVGVVLKEQMRGFGRIVTELTPPNRGASRGKAAKKAGEAAIEGDIRNAFEAVHPNRADITLGEMPGVVKGLRGGGRKRIRVRPSGARKAARGDLTKLIRETKRGVGHLAGAWITATRKWGNVPAPAWIKRHAGKAKGYSRLTIGSRVAIADVVNAVRFASGISGIERRVQAALNIQARRMDRRAEHAFKKRAERAGFKTS